MDRYTYPDEARAVLESQKQPLAVYQLINKKIVTVLVSDGFCELFGFSDHEQAAREMDEDMYKPTLMISRG